MAWWRDPGTALPIRVPHWAEAILLMKGKAAIECRYRSVQLTTRSDADSRADQFLQQLIDRDGADRTKGFTVGA